MARLTQISELRAPIADQLARLTAKRPFARTISRHAAAKALARFRSPRRLPRAPLDELRTLNLPVDEALSALNANLNAHNVPRSLSRVFRTTARLPHPAAQVLAPAASDPAVGWPPEGVIGALNDWLGGQVPPDPAICDDTGSGINLFTAKLAELRATLPNQPSTYAQTLAETLLGATNVLRAPCPPLTPAPTTHPTPLTPVATIPAAALLDSTDIDVSPDGSVVVADPSARTVTRYPADGGAAVVISDPLQTPTNVAVSADGDIFISDFDGMAVHRYHPDGTPVTHWGTQGAGPGQFDRPAGIALTPTGSVVVCDAKNTRLEVFTDTGTLISVIPSPPAGAPGHLIAPRGIAVSPDGSTVAVADRNDASVALFRLSDGAFLGATPPTADLGNPSPIGLYQPYAVRYDPTGGLWVADRGGQQLMRLDGSLAATRTINAFGFQPSDAIEPTALAFHGNTLFVLDYGRQQVLSVDPRP